MWLIIEALGKNPRALDGHIHPMGKWLEIPCCTTFYGVLMVVWI